MNAVLHRANIDCLVRQALVHNATLCLPKKQQRLHADPAVLAHGAAGRAPSGTNFVIFLFVAKSYVEAYKAKQKSAVDAQKVLIS